MSSTERKRQKSFSGRWLLDHAFRVGCLAGVLFFSPLWMTAAGEEPIAGDNPSVNSEWTPPSDGYDWIQLSSDEWLKGEIIGLYNKTLEFDSKKLKVLSLDWKDIKQIRTKRYHQVNVDKEEPAIGTLSLTGSKLTVRGREEVVVDRDLVVSIAAGEPKEINYWKAKVSLGLNIREGNASQVDYNTKWSIQRRTAKTRLALDYLGTINRSDTIDTANNHRVTSYFDYFYSRRFFVRPVNLEYFRDTFQNINSRYTLGAQLGYNLIDNKKTEWNITGGPGYQIINYLSVEPGAESTRKTFTGTVSSKYDTELTSWVDLISELQLTIGDKDSGGLNTHFITTFETELTSKLDLDISFIWDRVQNPVAGDNGVVPQQDDFRMTIGLGLDL
ncbi:MAG: DUF481 domain-containing protein [Opitutaceae bacterium]